MKFVVITGILWYVNSNEKFDFYFVWRGVVWCLIFTFVIQNKALKNFFSFFNPSYVKPNQNERNESSLLKVRQLSTKMVRITHQDDYNFPSICSHSLSVNILKLFIFN